MIWTIYVTEGSASQEGNPDVYQSSRDVNTGDTAEEAIQLWKQTNTGWFVLAAEPREDYRKALDLSDNKGHAFMRERVNFLLWHKSEPIKEPAIGPRKPPRTVIVQEWIEHGGFDAEEAIRAMRDLCKGM